MSPFKAIDRINISATDITNLIQKVNILNQYSSKLLQSSDSKLDREITSLKVINTELNKIVDRLDKHQEQVNLGLEKFGSKLLTSFEKQTSTNTIELQNLTTEIKNFVGEIRQNKTELTKLTSRLEYSLNDFNIGNGSLSDRETQTLENYNQ